MNIKITNGNIIDPANGINRVADLYIADTRIVAIDKAPADFVADEEIDATGKNVIPGIVDLCARLRDPGQTHKASIASETNAAVAAGITTICCPPDTSPVLDTPSVAELIKSRCEAADKAKVVTLGALTKKLEGKQISSMGSLISAGCVGVSDGRKPVADSLVLRRVMQYAETYGLRVFLSPIDAWLTEGGCMHEGEVSARLGMPSLPEATETAAIARDLALVEKSGIKVHFNQLSTKHGAKLIQQGQADGQNITVDVSAHQLFLTDEEVATFDSMYHVRPPLRSREDLEGLREAVRNNVIGAICSDHQPHDIDAKTGPFPATEAGISSLETLLPLVLKLVDEGVLPLEQAISKLTCEPAKILEIDAGTLSIGNRADICIYNPDTKWVFNRDEMLSQGKNSPFDGWEFKGKVETTFVNGKKVFQI